MKTTPCFSTLAKFMALASCFLPGLFLAQPGLALTCIWTGAGGDGNWDNPANWSSTNVPEAGDNVYITNNASLAVTVNDTAVFASLTVGGNSGTVTMTWNGGWLEGTLVLGQNAVLNLANPSSDHILSGVITNYGRINWQQGDWDFNNGSRLENKSGALVDVQCDQTVGCIGALNSVINNAGTFRKSAGVGETAVSPTPAVALNNTGLIDVESGTLALYGSGTNNGAINIAGDAIYALDGGVYWFAPANLFTGAGVCEMGQCSVFGTLQGPITYRIVYDVTFNTVLVSGTMIWDYTPGNQFGPLTIQSNAVYNIGSSCNVYGAMTNWGTIVYPAGSPWNGWSWGVPGRLENRPGGVINLQADLRFYDGSGVPFENAGTLLKSGGTGDSIIDGGFNFTNTGTIIVQSGTLSLNGLTSSNAIIIGAGATVSLENDSNVNGNFNFGPTNTFTGPGVLALNASSGLAIHGPLSGSAAFEMDYDAAFTNCILGGVMNWLAGDMEGVLTVGTNGVLVMLNSGTMSGSITNLGRINFDASGANPAVMRTFCSLSVGSNYVQGGGASLNMGVGGRTTDQYDQLVIGGAAKLNGLLTVNLYNGFPPASSDSFQLLSCASRGGTFSSLALPGGLSLAYTATGANLDVTGPVSVQPMLLTPQLTSGIISFDVLTASGSNYTVYRSDSLKPANWTTCTNLTGDGACDTISLPVGSGPSRFYRISQP